MTHIGGSADKHATKLIQHLGIVAGICKKSGLAELIDEQVEQPKRHVTVGQATVAMILNAICEHGIAELFSTVAASVLAANGISTRFAHLDSTTFSLHEQYNSELDSDEVEEGVIHMLNQVVAQFQHQFDRENMPYIVKDEAFYTRENLQSCEGGTRAVSGCRP